MYFPWMRWSRHKAGDWDGSLFFRPKHHHPMIVNLSWFSWENRNRKPNRCSHLSPIHWSWASRVGPPTMDFSQLNQWFTWFKPGHFFTYLPNLFKKWCDLSGNNRRLARFNVFFSTINIQLCIYNTHIWSYMIYYVSCMGITVRNLFISQTNQRIGFLHDIWGMAFTWNVAFCWVRNIGFHATLRGGIVFWNPVVSFLWVNYNNLHMRVNKGCPVRPTESETWPGKQRTSSPPSFMIFGKWCGPRTDLTTSHGK